MYAAGGSEQRKRAKEHGEEPAPPGDAEAESTGTHRALPGTAREDVEHAVRRSDLSLSLALSLFPTRACGNTRTSGLRGCVTNERDRK